VCVRGVCKGLCEGFASHETPINSHDFVCVCVRVACVYVGVCVLVCEVCARESQVTSHVSSRK